MNRSNQADSTDDSLARALLIEAFPGAKQRPDLTPPSHNDCVKLRPRLIAVAPKDLPFYLRAVLLDLLETRTDTPDGLQDAETVVQYLAATESSLDESSLSGHLLPEDFSKHRQDDQLLLAEKLQDFERFTKCQAEAVCHWLRVARKWPDLDSYSEDIERALAFWQTKAGTKF